MLTTRTCGVLLHPTSLPGYGGIGALGEEARRFVDLLSGMGMTFWQVLPLTPPGCGNSPYSAYSAFAGNPLLIDCDQLVREGDLPHQSVRATFNEEQVEFALVTEAKLGLLRQAAATFFTTGGSERMEAFWEFCNTTPWLHDYALFMAAKQHFKGRSWDTWPGDAALCTPQAYERLSIELGQEIGIQKYQQWQFFRQWRELRDYADHRGVRFIGDLPLFVAYDSADVWCRRDLFQLDNHGQPTSVAGVPPDYFSATGQLWGNPLYDWHALKQQGYSWWVDRFRHLFAMFDTVRIDHFRGFEAAWHVPADAKTAEFGSWVAGPDRDFFQAIEAGLGKLSIIAEDLGVITPAVEKLRDDCGYPGMKILQFAFDSGPGNPYLPHNHVKNCIVYTGTHDNNTSRGWGNALTQSQLCSVLEYIGCTETDLVEGLLRMAFMSVANTVIVPFQDLLGLPGEARMNIPGTANGNWGWRFSWSMIPRSLGPAIRGMVKRYGRLKTGTQ